ncbi:MAG: hypothetical protein M1294_03955 [Firmicutes bacterium]|uniref:YfiR C-terminal domain-containing protein n=1 Tax=Sulfobacillus benefaciens TaxID=453960 RepID=A0A2T2WTX6_9FIRM|nr:hypothetical protein [Bacillota bacterium]MCL5013028.1 hypothetical protein [Bacillota bacterium]PSR25676.1 MAG: hypothetical protein C7B43_16290 [Sulfobacillus benefaciens]
MIVEYNLEHRDDPKRRQHILNRSHKFTEALVQMIRAGVDRGEFHPRLRVVAIARFLINAQDGWAVQMAVTGSTDKDILKEYGQAIGFFLRESLGFQ